MGISRYLKLEIFMNVMCVILITPCGAAYCKLMASNFTTDVLQSITIFGGIVASLTVLANKLPLGYKLWLPLVLDIAMLSLLPLAFMDDYVSTYVLISAIADSFFMLLYGVRDAAIKERIKNMYNTADHKANLKTIVSVTTIIVGVLMVVIYRTVPTLAEDPIWVIRVSNTLAAAISPLVIMQNRLVMRLK